MSNRIKICGIYKITNTVTNDFYIGSSKDVKHRWRDHKRPSMRKKHPNSQLYKDFQKYGLENFIFEVLEEVAPEKLREKEQQFIETLKPTYNSNRAKGCDIERYREYQMEYYKSDKGKETQRKASNKYNNQLCFYEGEYLTLCALRTRFRRKGIDHPQIEAKKYLI